MKNMSIYKILAVRKLSQFARTFLRDERGQSTTEYILILAVVVMVALKFKKSFEGTMNTGLKSLDSSMNSAFEGIGNVE